VSLPHVNRPAPHEPKVDDPVLRNSRREARVIALIWAIATTVCCTLCGWLGFNAEAGGPIATFAGIPRWFFWGVMVPWLLCIVVTWWFAGVFMVEDDLGTDHSSELESDIREQGHADRQVEGGERHE
jgi:hypothetical protein